MMMEKKGETRVTKIVKMNAQEKIFFLLFDHDHHEDDDNDEYVDSVLIIIGIN